MMDVTFNDRHSLAISQPIDKLLVSSKSMWEGLAGKKILITGGTGFFGSWLLETVLRASETQRIALKLIVLTRSPDRFRCERAHLANHPSVELIVGDIRTFNLTQPIDYLIHAATDSTPSVKGVDPSEERDVIIRGTSHVFLMAKQWEARKALYVSSGAVYGRQPAEIAKVPEEYADLIEAGSRTTYGNAKWDAEQLCLNATGNGLPTTIARCFAFVGPYLPLNAHFAIGNFIRDALHGGPINVNGDGTPLRSYLYMSDLSHWLWTMLLLGDAGRAYNVGSETSLSIAEIARAVAQTPAGHLAVHIKQMPNPGSPVHRYIPSTDRAQAELGLGQSINLEQSIVLTKSWYDFKDSSFIGETT
jgi:dTDP-glucose 4,6-dehydratase